MSPRRGPRRLRGGVRLVLAVGHALHGLMQVSWQFPRLDRAARLQRIARWSRTLLQRLGARIEVSGDFTPGPRLLVANHVSWLDIMAVHTVCPEARFVSKADVRAWPLVSRLVDAAGTLYLHREHRRDALRVVHEMAQALQSGDVVAVFPEGTTGNGRDVLPFHANLLQSAVATGIAVQPVVLRYADATSAYSEAALYLGETTLMQSLWRLACAEGLVLHLQVLTPQPPGEDRRALATVLRQRVVAALPA